MFIQDIEDEPELRHQIDLFRNDDVIKQLESKLAGMNLEEEKQKAEGKVKEEKKTTKDKRKVATAVRKTKEGQKKQSENQASKRKNDLLIKATMKDKQDDNDSDWESAEEDYQHIQIDELKSLED